MKESQVTITMPEEVEEKGRNFALKMFGSRRNFSAFIRFLILKFEKDDNKKNKPIKNK